MFKRMDSSAVKKYGFFAAVFLILAAIVVIVVVSICSGNDQPQEADVKPEKEPIVRYVTKDKIVYKDKLVPVEVEKKITTDIMEEGLHDMGLLITENYWFKEVTTIDSSKTMLYVFKADSKVVMGYEGELLAGTDFEKIKVAKDDVQKIIRVTMPEAEIVACDLDLDSFELYEEKVSRWNMISADDYNGSLKELEQRATERALDRGILEKAEAQAETLIRSFINGHMGSEEYTITFEQSAN